MHVDDFIDKNRSKDKSVIYARWFFQLHRFPALHQSDFREFLAKYKLFCTWNGKRYRVTGCSRLGDVWLAADFNQEIGYDHRVDVFDCSNWSDTPE